MLGVEEVEDELDAIAKAEFEKLEKKLEEKRLEEEKKSTDQWLRSEENCEWLTGHWWPTALLCDWYLLVVYNVWNEKKIALEASQEEVCVIPIIFMYCFISRFPPAFDSLFCFG